MPVPATKTLPAPGLRRESTAEGTRLHYTRRIEIKNFSHMFDAADARPATGEKVILTRS